MFFRAWQRPRVYIIGSHRAGDPNVGWVLSRFPATHDFAGGPDRKPTPGHDLGPHGSRRHTSRITVAINGSGAHTPEARLIEDMLHARVQPVMAPLCRTVPYDLLHGQQPRMATCQTSSKV